MLCKTWDLFFSLQPKRRVATFSIVLINSLVIHLHFFNYIKLDPDLKHLNFSILPAFLPLFDLLLEPLYHFLLFYHLIFLFYSFPINPLFFNQIQICIFLSESFDMFLFTVHYKSHFRELETLFLPRGHLKWELNLDRFQSNPFCGQGASIGVVLHHSFFQTLISVSSVFIL